MSDSESILRTTWLEGFLVGMGCGLIVGGALAALVML